MSRSDDKRLDDIVAAAAEISDIVDRGREAFDGDLVLRRALERCVEILGEAAKALSDEVRQEIPEVPWSQVGRLRDRLSHHYRRIDAGQLWVTAEVDVPRLAAAVHAWRARQSGSQQDADVAARSRQGDESA